MGKEGEFGGSSKYLRQFEFLLEGLENSFNFLKHYF